MSDDYGTGLEGRDPSPERSDSSWPTYSSTEDKVTAALRLWVQGMEEALARASAGTME